jgi:hypothetical protein
MVPPAIPPIFSPMRADNCRSRKPNLEV